MGRRGARAGVVVLAGREPRAEAATLTLRWRIAFPTGGEAALECRAQAPTADAPGGSLAFTLNDAGGRRALERSAGPITWTRDAESALEHIDAPGLLACTFERTEGGGLRVLYARTPMLVRAGSAGGWHELAGAELAHAPPKQRALERV